MTIRRIIAAALALCLAAFGAAAQTGTVSGASVTATGGTAARTLAAIAADTTASAGFTGIDPTGATDSTVGLQAFVAHGGRLLALAGTYKITSTLLMPSNTALICQPGVVFKAANPWVGTNHQIIFNTNNTAGTITDHDMSVEGCGFDYSGITYVGGQQAVSFRMAQHIRVRNINCSGGGDCTAMVATNDTEVSGSRADGVANLCWDHWEGATNGSVHDNPQCNSIVVGGTSQGSGIMVTGLGNTTPAGVASHFKIHDNIMNTQGVGIWVNGLGTAGSGVTDIDITNNTIQAGSNGGPCIKVSGGGTDVVVTNNRCAGGNGSWQGIYSGAGGDTGGLPTNTIVKGGIFNGWNAGTQPMVQLMGAGDSVEGIKITGGSYTYGVTLGGDGQFAAHNQMTAGSTGLYSLGAATSFTVIEPDQAVAWTPTLTFGGTVTGITYATRTGTYWLNGKLVTVCVDIQLSSKGSATGAVGIASLPFKSAVFTHPNIINVSVGLAQALVGVSSPAPFANVVANNTVIGLYTDVSRTTALTDTSFGSTALLGMCGTYPIQ